MFSKILENPGLPFNEQKEVIKNVLAVNLKQNIYEVRLQFNHNYEKLKPVLLKHWKYAFRLVLPLQTWQISRDLLQNKKDNPASDLLYSLVAQAETEKARYLLVDLAKSYAQNTWRSLSVLTLVAQNMASSLPSKDFGWFLASFVRISAAAIQSYLKLKHEPAKSNEDRIQNDLILITKCQEWLTTAFIKLISSLMGPQKNDKHTVLAAWSQVVGALLQNQKAGELEGQKLRDILRECKNYLLRSYTIKQVGQFYVNMLRATKYSHRLGKIQIPQQYTNKSPFANEGIAWLLLNMAQNSNLAYSQNLKLNWLLLAFSQTLESPLPLKQSILTEIETLFKVESDTSEFANNYPVGLLLFNVYQYKKDKLDYFKEQFGIGKDQGNDLRLWRRLLTINIPDLNVQKITLVVSQIGQSAVKNPQILLLIKPLKFEFVNEELCNSLATLFLNIASTHGSTAKKIISNLIKTQRSNDRNPQFCKQISKTLDL